MGKSLSFYISLTPILYFYTVHTHSSVCSTAAPIVCVIQPPDVTVSRGSV